MNNELNKWPERAHETSKSKGFYELPTNILRKMEDGNDGSFGTKFSEEEIKAVKDAFIAQRLMLITSELGEALEANRKGKSVNIGAFEKNFDFTGLPFDQAFKERVKDSFEDELADSMIRLFDLCGWLNIDIEKHVELKHLYNTTRERLHGKKF